MTKPRKIAVDAEDVRLFEQSVGPVRRIRVEEPHSTRAQPAPEPVQSRLDEARVPGELIASVIDPGSMEIGEELSYLKEGLSPQLLRKLKRGHFSIADEMDLHQMTAEVARGAIKAFLAECRRDGKLCVKIIHGKGLRSRSQGPVLKRLTDGMLRQRGDVLAFASAKSADGGTGAVIVLMKR